MNCKHPDSRETQQLLKLWKAVFGEYNGFWELFLDTGYQSDHCCCMVENGRVTAGLYWFDCSCACPGAGQRLRQCDAGTC